MIRVRPARADDAPQVADVMLASRRRFLPYLPEVHPEPEMRAWVASTLVPAGGVHVAEAGGQIHGVLALAVHEGVGWIDHLYLRPEAVNQGLGSRLLGLALAELPRPVRLYTFQANSGARRFYERHGFRVIAAGDGSGNEEGQPDLLYERLA